MLVGKGVDRANQAQTGKSIAIGFEKFIGCLFVFST